jgi:phage tail-like protein
MRDANGSFFLPLVGHADLAPRAPGLRWDAELAALRFARSATPRLPQAPRAAVLSALAAAPSRVLDGFGQQGRLAPDGSRVEVLVDGAWTPVLDRDGTALVPAAGRFTALAIGGGRDEARLTLLFDDGAGARGVQMFHLRQRWPIGRPGETRCDLPAPGQRVAVAPDGTIWVATADRLLALSGQPLPLDYRKEQTRFEPQQVVRRGFRVVRDIALGAAGTTLGLAVDGQAAWLLRDAGAAAQEVWRRPLAEPDDRPAVEVLALPAHGPAGGPFFSDLALLPEGRLALLAPADTGDPGFARRDCAVFLRTEAALPPSGERWPMLGPPEPRFVTTATGHVAYATAEGPQALAMLRHPAHPTRAATRLGPLDAGAPETVWHRLHLDAAIPPGCAIGLWARAAQEALLPAEPPARAARMDLLLAEAVALLQAEPAIASFDGFVLELLRLRHRVQDAPLWQALAALPDATLARLAAMTASELGALGDDPAFASLAGFDALLPALAGAPLDAFAAASPALRRVAAGAGDLAARLEAAIAEDAALLDALRAALDSPLHRQPAPVWSPTGSEIPWHAGFCPPERNRAGTFELLLQRPDGAVRRLIGRRLDLVLVFSGDGRASPSLHALRAHAPRFSYQEAYLPALFCQGADPDDTPGPANGADLRERLFSAFEAVLTPLEDRIAESEVLLDPARAPAAALPFLASLFGRGLETGWPEARQRAMLGGLGALLPRRGTLAGVLAALDVASDGGARRGEVVVVENYRLRRSMATILGIPMDDADHPLTLGSGASGNSIVGDTLILSESATRDFLAMFSPDLARADERAAVRDFLDRHAHQVTILLHGRGAAARPAIETAARREMPAHVHWRVIEAESGFVLGLAPLLGVDSFLEVEPPPAPVALDEVAVGRGGLLMDPAALAPEAVSAALRRGGT